MPVSACRVSKATWRSARLLLLFSERCAEIQSLNVRQLLLGNSFSSDIVFFKRFEKVSLIQTQIK